jgi:colanic acid biosynthesis protein WcaH
MRIPDEIYQVILRVMPIPCVDLVVCKGEEVLLVRRNNEPALGQWWFPGGRIHFGETLEAAARRKLTEECGLHALRVEQRWTRDVILARGGDSASLSHGITTVFAVTVDPSEVILDNQAREYSWRTPAAWKEESLHSFVSETLERVTGDVAPQESLQVP